jgi:hypothetical protein
MTIWGIDENSFECAGLSIPAKSVVRIMAYYCPAQLGQ